MRKKIGIIISIFIALVILDKIYLVYKDYTISDNITNIKHGIEKSMKRSSNHETNLNIDIKEILNIYNKKYVVFTIKDKIGNAELTKGINGKYKVSSNQYGHNLRIREMYETDKRKYILVTSKNYDFKAYYAKVTLIEYDDPIHDTIKNSTEYILEIPKQEYYILCQTIPNNTDISNSYLEVQLLDKEKKDITSEMLDIHSEYRENVNMKR